MKIKDILNEEVTDVIARFYKEASKESDRYLNPEDVKYKGINREYYDKYFKSWFNEEIVPVFRKPVNKAQPAYRPDPQPGVLQTPGYRGLQNALFHAGLPYNHNVQRYDPSIPMAASQTMDGARNNNGQ